LPDGSINQIKRDRIVLTKTMRFHQFSQICQCLTRKKPVEKIIPKKMILFNDNISNTTDQDSETFNHLWDILKNMALPDEWFFTYLHRSLIFGNLDSNYELIKKVIINNDLNLKVWFLKC